MSSLYPAYKADEKFNDAQLRAFIQDILATLTRRKSASSLLSYEEIRSHLKTLEERPRGTQLIPIDQIVGSVGRYRDFTREFLPRRGANRERWKQLDVAINRLQDIPPIEVYKIGDVYFVKDGNHRVSVARANGFTHIEAIVTEIRTRAPFTPDMDPQEFILREEYAAFLERTHLDKLRPEQHIVFSTPGRYAELLDHISVHRYYLGIEQNREIPYKEAVTSWYDNVYKPAVEVIRRRGILRYFPGRTEADLYVWVIKYLGYLREAYDNSADLDQAADELIELAELAEEVTEKSLPGKVVGPLVNVVNVIKEKVEELAGAEKAGEQHPSTQSQDEE
jgi:hypothetical protein